MRIPQNDIIAPFKVDLAKVLFAQGNLKEAEVNYLQALESIKVAYGAEHLYTVEVMGDIARLYILENRYDEAKPLIASTLKIQKSIYGPENHLIAPTLIVMANIYQVEGKYEQSMDLINEARSVVGKTRDIIEIAKLEQLVGKTFAGKEVARVFYGR